MKQYFTLLLAFSVTVSCVPKRQKMDFTSDAPVAPIFIQPATEPATPSTPIKTEAYSYESGPLYFNDLLEMAENLHHLAQTYPQLTKLQQSVDQIIADELKKTTGDMTQSAYFKVVLQEAVPQVEQSTTTISTELSDNMKRLKKLFLNSKLAIKPNYSIKKFATAVDTGFSKLITAIKSIRLNQELKTKLISELSAKHKEYRTLFRDLVKIDTTSKTLTTYTKGLSARLQEAGMTSGQKDLKRALRLGAKVDQIRDAQSALSAIIYVWGMLKKNERKEVIGSLNPELYEYLSEQNKEELDCLASSRCDDILLSLTKSLGVLPSIKEFGIKNIRAKINAGSIAYVRERLQRQLFEQLKDFGPTINAQVGEQVSEKQEFIKKINKNFASDLINALPGWAKTAFSPADGGPQMMADPVYQMYFADNQIQLLPTSHGRPSNGIGSWINYIIPRLNGTREASGPNKQALFTVLEYIARKHLTTTEAKQPDADFSYIAAERIDLIRALSRVVNYTADWKTSSYDAIIGSHKLYELFPDLPKNSLDRAIFPKDAALLLTLSALGQELKEFERQKPPIFLLTAEKSLQLSNRRKSNDPADAPIMAGIMDIMQGQASNTVKVETIARAIITLSDFLDATKNLHLTSVKRLHSPDASGEQPIAQFTKARKAIKQFILGLCNLLTNVGITANGLVGNDISLTDTAQVQGAFFSLENQALAIRALIKGAEATGLVIYTWDALTLLNKLNAEYFDSDAGFYRLQSKHGSVYGSLEMAIAIEAIKPYMEDPEAKEMLERIKTHHLNKLGSINIQMITAEPAPR